jgi:putative oxidoreductase
MEKTSLILYWGARLVAALIMLQTLYFKFSGSEESVYIFTTVGMEPWGRIGIGVLELIASVLLLFNATAWIGSGLALGLMTGAIAMHLTKLGISVRDDGGYLFFLAVAVALCSAVVLFKNKEKIFLLARVQFTSGIRK